MYEIEKDPSKLDDLVTFLKKVELFQSLPSSFLEELSTSMKLLSFEGGETLMRQHEIGDCLYILVQGQLKILIEKEGIISEAGQISQGQIVGEIALLVNQPRNATVKAIRDSLVLKLDKTTFFELLQKDPNSIMKITQMCINRLLHKPRMRKNLITLAFIPAGDDYRSHKTFAKELSLTMNSHAKVLLLNSKNCDRLFGKDSAETPFNSQENLAFSEWLNHLESQYDFILYEADSTLTNWTKRCLRQADRIFLVAQADLCPNLRSIEKELFSRTISDLPYIELILIQRSFHSIHHTKKWFANRHLFRHHHVRLNNLKDFQRIYRFITGQARGLVLSGGASKGPIYFGVFKAIRELELEIDMVAGTSVGGMTAAFFALDFPEEIREKKIYNVIENFKLDYTFPLISFFKGKNWTMLVQDFLDTQTHIEDLPINFFCVSANLTLNQQEIHTEGLLWEAIRASSSLPAIFPPISKNSQMLVDGGIVNNMPVDIMRYKLDGGKIIAVECITEDDKNITYLINESWLSGWKELIKGFLPLKKRTPVPFVFEVIGSTIAIGEISKRDLMRKQADHYLLITAPPVGLLEKKFSYQLLEVGYQTSIKFLRKIF